MILVDTGFWLAVAASSDRHHKVAVAALDRAREPLITTGPVITETCHLLAARVGIDAQLSFLRGAESRAFEVFNVERAHLPRIRALIDKYRDLPMDLADASLVVLAEALGTGRILSTDTRDFGTYRWKNRKPFKNLLKL